MSRRIGGTAKQHCCARTISVIVLSFLAVLWGFYVFGMASLTVLSSRVQEENQKPPTTTASDSALLAMGEPPSSSASSSRPPVVVGTAHARKCPPLPMTLMGPSSSRVEAWAAAQLLRPESLSVPPSPPPPSWDGDVPYQLARGMSVVANLNRRRFHRLLRQTQQVEGGRTTTTTTFNESLPAFVARCVEMFLPSTTHGDGGASRVVPQEHQDPPPSRNTTVIVFREEKECVAVRATPAAVVADPKSMTLWSNAMYLDDDDGDRRPPPPPPQRSSFGPRRVLQALPEPWGAFPWRFWPHAEYRARIVFGVLAAAPYLADRLIPALNTWLCDVDAVILFEEDEASRALVDRLLLRAPPPPALGSWNMTTHIPPRCMENKKIVYEKVPYAPVYRSKNGAWKDFALVPHLYRLFPEKHWYAVVDDDTWVIQENLNILLASQDATTGMNPLVNRTMMGQLFSVQAKERYQIITEFRRIHEAWKTNAPTSTSAASLNQSARALRDVCGNVPNFRLSMLTNVSEACQFRDEWALTHPALREAMKKDFAAFCNDTSSRSAKLNSTTGVPAAVLKQRNSNSTNDTTTERSKKSSDSVCLNYTQQLAPNLSLKVNHFMFANGGSGMLLSRAALVAFVESLPVCAALCRESYGDGRMGCCAFMTGTHLQKQRGFYNVHPTKILNLVSSLKTFPLSFHNQRTTELSVFARHTILSARRCLWKRAVEAEGRGGGKAEESSANAAAFSFANSPVTPWDAREQTMRSDAWWDWTCTMWPEVDAAQKRLHHLLGGGSSGGDSTTTSTTTSAQWGLLIPYDALSVVYNNRTYPLHSRL